MNYKHYKLPITQNSKTMNNEPRYIIVGDTEEQKQCLIYTCGKSKEYADTTLQQMLNSPTEKDKSVMKGLKNFRVKKVAAEKCWWEINPE